MELARAGVEHPAVTEGDHRSCDSCNEAEGPAPRAEFGSEPEFVSGVRRSERTSTGPRCHEALNGADEVLIDRRPWHFVRRPVAARKPISAAPLSPEVVKPGLSRVLVPGTLEHGSGAHYAKGDQIAVSLPSKLKRSGPTVHHNVPSGPTAVGPEFAGSPGNVDHADPS